MLLNFPGVNYQKRISWVVKGAESTPESDEQRSLTLAKFSELHHRNASFNRSSNNDA